MSEKTPETKKTETTTTATTSEPKTTRSSWPIWLIIVGLIGSIVCFIIRAFDEETEYVLSAAEVEKIEKSKFRI